MNQPRTSSGEHAACLEWLSRFASEAAGTAGRRRSTSELQRHLREFYDTLVDPSSTLAPPRPTSHESEAWERSAPINGVAETLYVVGSFAASPSLSDVWLRGQVRRFLNTYTRLTGSAVANCAQAH